MLVKEYQSKRIVDFIREYGPRSRVELAEKLGISKSTLTRVTNRLVEKGILYEGEYGVSNGGRRPVFLHFNYNCSYSFGISLGRDELSVALLNLNGHIISIRNQVNLNNKNFDFVLHFIEDAVASILEETKINRDKILGIGIGLPGPLNEDELGRISPPNFYGESDIPLKKFINQRLGFNVILENDASVAALAERRHGGNNETNFIYILADVGIGSGIIVKGELLRGYKGDAGEIGHTTVNVFGEKCTCGSYGCLETIVSITKVKENFISKAKLSGVEFPFAIEEVTFDQLLSLEGEGKKIADDVFKEAGRYLGVGISNMINLLSPKKIIIGGRLGVSSELLLEEVLKTIKTRTVSKHGANVAVETSKMNHSIVIGAGALVSDHFFQITI